jgi:hypothetical protein
MAGELIERMSVLAAKIEVTAGSAETLAAADGAMNCSNMRITELTEYVDLMGQGPTIDEIRGSHGAVLGQATFDVELLPGSGALPLWATALLPACGWTVSTATYAPKSEIPGTNVKTVTIGNWTGPSGTGAALYEQLHGASGTAVFNFPTGRPGFVSFTFTGQYTKPAAAEVIAPNYPLDVQSLRFVSSSLVIGSVQPAVDSLTLDLGNTVSPILDSRTATGYSHSIIVARRPTITISPNATLPATYDPWTDFTSHTQRSISWSLAQGGVGLTFTFPACELTAAPGRSERGGLRTTDLTFKANRNTDLGDDSGSLLMDISP